MKIAIQGGQASFHDMATRQYFTGRRVELLECQTFRQLCRRLLEKEADLAVMAIENSLVGSILPNYALLQEYPFFIIGETYLHIQQNLMALPGQSLADIQYIRSHPMALHQCSDFLESHPGIRVIETFDTAESAREIREKEMKGVAVN
jgi:prephenate dehydratase